MAVFTALMQTSALTALNAASDYLTVTYSNYDFYIPKINLKS